MYRVEFFNSLQKKNRKLSILPNLDLKRRHLNTRYCWYQSLIATCLVNVQVLGGRFFSFWFDVKIKMSTSTLLVRSIVQRGIFRFGFLSTVIGTECTRVIVYLSITHKPGSFQQKLKNLCWRDWKYIFTKYQFIANVGLLFDEKNVKYFFL